MLDVTTDTANSITFQQLGTFSVETLDEAAIEWYRSNIRRAASGPFCELVTITPERAKVLLTFNPQNRGLSNKRLAELRVDMLRGQFRLNGETIIVSREGYMNDGQHRCVGAVETGTSFQTFMVWGVERDSRLTVDTGTARKTANFIHMEGGDNSNLAASIMRWVILHKRNAFTVGGAGVKDPTKAEIIAAYLECSDEIQHAIRVTRRKNSSELRSNTPLGAAYIIISRNSRSQADVDAFFDKLCEGAGYDVDSPLHVLRQKLVRMDRMRPGEKIALIIGGWNNHRAGVKKLKTIQMNGRYPQVRP